MSTLSHAVSDSATMLRRNVRHTLRYPVTMVMSVGVPAWAARRTAAPTSTMSFRGFC